MEIIPIATTAVATSSTQDPVELAAEWFKLDLANGDARKDTIRTYLSHVRQWFKWCGENGIAPAAATPDDVKRYRQHLGNDGLKLKRSTITLKITSIRRFYGAAVERKLIEANPAAGIKAQRDRTARADVKHFSAGEAELIFRAIPGDDVRSNRDRMIVVMMMIEGLRRVEIRRMSEHDMENMDDPEKCRILIHGKGKDAFIYPRAETITMLKEYLTARGTVQPDDHGVPVFTSIDKGSTPRRRLSRRGINTIVNKHLESSAVKKKGKSCHALRHTCGFLIYKETKDLRVVQEVLRHSDLEMAATYADVDASKNRYTNNITIKIR
jgi:site-specific recombinase XerD